MADSDGQEKTEQASGKRLSDSRDKGQVARSMEVNSFVVFTAGALILYMAQKSLATDIREMTDYTLRSLNTFDITFPLLQVYAIKGFLFIIKVLSPFFVGLVLVSLAAGYGQVGFKITPKALAPKFNKLNPLNGIKNILFSTRSMTELLKALFKLIIVGFVAWGMIKDVMERSVSLINFSVDEIAGYMTDVTFPLIWKIAVVYGIFAFSDLLYQRFKFKKDLMMTKQEVKEEGKEAEGDPLVKGKIRSKMMQIAKSRMMKEVPKADVVITNPTHVAVALKYDASGKAAPKVIAKGLDEVAQRIKQIAKDNNVPLHEDVQLARALYKSCDLGDQIPETMYRAVAQILAAIFRAKNERKRRSIV